MKKVELFLRWLIDFVGIACVSSSVLILGLLGVIYIITELESTWGWAIDMMATIVLVASIYGMIYFMKILTNNPLFPRKEK